MTRASGSSPPVHPSLASRGTDHCLAAGNRQVASLRAPEPVEGPRSRGVVSQSLKTAKPWPLMILPQVHLRKPCYDFYFL